MIAKDTFSDLGWINVLPPRGGGIIKSLINRADRDSTRIQHAASPVRTKGRIDDGAVALGQLPYRLITDQLQDTNL